MGYGFNLLGLKSWGIKNVIERETKIKYKKKIMKKKERILKSH